MNEKNSSEDPRLEQFAERFSVAIPELPDEAIDRIEQSMGREIRRVSVIRFRRAVLAVSVAAAVLLVVVGVVMQQRSAQRPDVAEQPGPVVPVREEAIPEEKPAAEIPAVVEDRMIVAVAAPALPAEKEEPLVPLDDYRSLIGDVN